jgi:hypothetical protein
MDKYEILMDLMRYRKQFHNAGYSGDWKQRLLEDWISCGSRTFYQGDWANLQRARNTLGPKWLYTSADFELEDFNHKLQEMIANLEVGEEEVDA